MTEKLYYEDIAADDIADRQRQRKCGHHADDLPAISARQRIIRPAATPEEPAITVTKP